MLNVGAYHEMHSMHYDVVEALESDPYLQSVEYALELLAWSRALEDEVIGLDEWRAKNGLDEQEIAWKA